MAQHLSDEEQIESLKRWWKDNGTQLILMVALVVGGWFGWQQWQDYRENKAAEASAIYNDIVTLVGQGSMDALNDTDKQHLRELAEALRVDHDGSQYAQYANMMLARLAVGEGQLEKAEELLQQVIDASNDDELTDVVRVRLARVEAAQKNYARALETLNTDVPVEMTALYAELRGDIYFYMNDFIAARAAYQLALASLSEREAGARPLLNLKLNRVLDGAAIEPPAAAEKIGTVATPGASLPETEPEALSEESEKSNTETSPETNQGEH